MIDIKYSRRDDMHELKLKGHAQYGETGSDIVCSAVSAITYSLLAFLDKHPECTKDTWDNIRSGNTKVYCQGDETVRTAFEMALTGYQMIAEEYPDNVRVTIA